MPSIQLQNQNQVNSPSPAHNKPKDQLDREVKASYVYVWGRRTSSERSVVCAFLLSLCCLLSDYWPLLLHGDF